MKNGLRLIISFFVTLLACSTFQPPATPRVSASLRKIAFVSERDGNCEIYVMNSDGSGQTRLTNNSASDVGPIWSPDGKKIAFTSDRDGDYEIYLMNVDGSGQTRVTHTSASSHFYNSYAWSPDGTKITFALDVSTPDTENIIIYEVNADGSDLIQLTDSQGINHSPDWSPNENLISFVSERDRNPEIYVMNADGSNQVRLTNSESQDFSQVWSPNSKQIAFTSYRDGNGEIYIVGADSFTQSRITYNNEDDFPLTWLPSGEVIALRVPRNSTGEGDIYSITADGSRETFLASINSDAPEIASPDGRQVAFVTTKDGDLEIYVVDLQSSTQSRLTDNSAGDYHPAWQP